MKKLEKKSLKLIILFLFIVISTLFISNKVDAAVVGDSFTFSGGNNDTGRPIVPTVATLSISGDLSKIYCRQKGAYLRTTADLGGHYEGETYYKHSKRKCGTPTSYPKGNGITYLGETVYTIKQQLPLNNTSYKYQYLAYIMGNLKNNDTSSTAAQYAVWYCQKSNVDTGILTPINSGRPVNQPDPYTGVNTDTATNNAGALRQLKSTITGEVSAAANDVLRAKSKAELIDIYNDLIKVMNTEANTSNTIMRNFYRGIVDDSDGLAGVVNWLRVQKGIESVTEPGPGSNYTKLSDMKANAYQYLLTVNNEVALNVMDKVNNQIEILEGSLGSGADEYILAADTTGAYLKNEAIKFQEYYNRLQKNDGKLKVTDETAKTTVLINRDEKSYTVGPYVVGYDDSSVMKSMDTNKRVDFAMISAINIYDQNGNCRTVSYKLNEDGSIAYDENGKLIVDKSDFNIVRKKIMNTSDPDYMFPKDGEEFYINYNSLSQYMDPSSIRVEVEFTYIKNYEAGLYIAQGNQQAYRWQRGQKYVSTYDCGGDTCNGNHKCTEYEYEFKKYPNGNKTTQEMLVVTESHPIYDHTKIMLKGQTYSDGDDDDDDDDITMIVSGNVWEEKTTGDKESTADGIGLDGEKLLKNIKVTLYQVMEDGSIKLAELENAKKGTRTNPTLTDANGFYKFAGVWAMGQYYVEFTYNGQIYQSTYYTPYANTNTIYTGQKYLSRASEYIGDRDEYNEKYASMDTTDSNSTFTQQKLAGYSLVNSGGTYKYKKDGNEQTLQLLDDYVNGTYTEGVISKVIQQLIKQNKAYPDDSEIYDALVEYIDEKGYDSSDLEEKLAFIEESQITSVTGGYKSEQDIENDNFNLTLYGRYKYMNMNTIKVNFDNTSANSSFVIINPKEDVLSPKDFASTPIEYSPIYKTTYYYHQEKIDFGLVRRPETDMALKKDVEKVTLALNGKEQVYNYDTREGNDRTWDITVRLSDGAYYNSNYTREILKSDYDYKVSLYGDGTEQGKLGKDKSKELEVYITYKLTVRNQSLSIKTRIDEIVDYYDQDLEYQFNDERSYIEIKNGENQGKYSANASSTSKYGSRTTISGYDNLYIKGLDKFYLNPGQTAYVYLTYKVKKDSKNSEDWLRLDEELTNGVSIGVGKENIAEINGYSTAYAEGSTIPVFRENSSKTDNKKHGRDVSGKPAGLIDKDSIAGNLNPADVPKDGEIKYENFEDDTDKSPNMKLVIYKDSEYDRVIEGTVWEDERNETIGATTTGNGLRENTDLPINGVTVQLVELMDNGTEYVWREFGATGVGKATIGQGTGSGTKKQETPIINISNLVSNYDLGENYSGKYAFKSFVPGNYVVRFIYGDTVKTVLTSDATDEANKSIGQTGLNTKSYNGQDYKSTTYQEGINQDGSYTVYGPASYNMGTKTNGSVLKTIRGYNKNTCTQNESGTYYYDIAAADANLNVSDAKDIDTNGKMDIKDGANNMKQIETSLNTRSDVIDYSDNDMMNHIAEVLASHKDVQSYYGSTEMQALLNELIAKTKMTSETGAMNIELERNTSTSSGTDKGSIQKYKITNVDLGLEERPKAQIEVDKKLTNVKVTLADKSVLFDSGNSGNNVQWINHTPYLYGYESKTNLLDLSKFGNGTLEGIRRQNANKFGLVNLNMDEELMHGATVQLTYEVTATNVGEADYKETSFYYTGNVKDTSTIVTTTPNQLIDYVANNLQFYEADNTAGGWKVIQKADLISKGLVNEKLTSKVNTYNTVITTGSLASNLVPAIYEQKVDKNAQYKVSVPLVLTQLITAENETDDLTYRNIVELVRTSNSVGRKNEYSVAGNQDPTKDPQELDTDISETVRIYPPFGENKMIYFIIGTVIAVAGILAVGIIFIKKKILK